MLETLVTKVLKDVAALEAIRPAWETLLARSSNDEVTVDPRWVMPWLEVYGEGRELRCIAIYEEERLVGLAPMVLRKHIYRPRIPFRRLELIGSGEDEADETCSDYIGIVVEKGKEKAAVEAFVEAIETKLQGEWDELVFHAMNGTTEVPELLRAALAERKIETELEAYDSCPFVKLPATWDAYVASLKRKKRWQLRQVTKHFEEWAGHEPIIRRAKTVEEVAEAKTVLHRLHRERWASPGVFGSPVFNRFHDRVMGLLLPHDSLDLGWLEAKGEPVAAFYNFRWRGKEYHYQSGRKVGLPDGVRVGIMMNAALIKQAIADGMKEYDFLAGDSVYKTALAPSSRPLVHLRAVRPSLVELARRAADRARGFVGVARRAIAVTRPIKPPPQSVR